MLGLMLDLSNFLQWQWRCPPCDFGGIFPPLGNSDILGSSEFHARTERALRPLTVKDENEQKKVETEGTLYLQSWMEEARYPCQTETRQLHFQAEMV